MHSNKDSNMRNLLFVGLAVFALASTTVTLHAAAISPGDLVIYRVGDGTAALGTTATSVFLDEYTTGGSLVQSIPLPTSGAGVLTAVGNATTEGDISRSSDGTTLTFTGYQKTAGGTSPASDTYLVTPRLIGALSLSGAVSQYSLTNVNGSTAANTIRSATSVDGSSAFWISTSVNVDYVGSPSPFGSGATLIDARNSRQVNLGGTTLYGANGSTTITGKVQSYGVLPTGATVPTAVVTLALADAVNSFALFDLDPSASADSAGDDTLYALSTVEGLLRKYTFNGSSWVASGSTATAAANLTGSASGGSVSLFLTTTTTLSTITDSSGYNANLTGSISSLATAGANTGFRGLNMFPVPEPSTAVLGGLGLLGLIFARRNKK